VYVKFKISLELEKGQFEIWAIGHMLLETSRVHAWTTEVCFPCILDAFLPNAVLVLMFNALEHVLQGKRGVWIKVPIQLVNLVEAAVKVTFLPV